MDGRFREDKAKKHIDRLDFISDQLKEEQSDENQFNAFELESRLHETTQYYNISVAVLFLITLAILVHGYIKNGGIIYYLLPAVLLIGYVFYYRISTKSSLDKFDLLKPKAPYSDDSKEHQLAVLNYLKSSVQVEYDHLLLVRTFYIGFFPLLLYYLKDYVVNISDSSIYWLLLLIFALGSAGFWWHYYDKELKSCSTRILNWQDQINQLLTSLK